MKPVFIILKENYIYRFFENGDGTYRMSVSRDIDNNLDHICANDFADMLTLWGCNPVDYIPEWTFKQDEASRKRFESYFARSKAILERTDKTLDNEPITIKRSTAEELLDDQNKV